MKTPKKSKHAFNKTEKLKKKFHEKCQKIAKHKLEEYKIEAIESPEPPQKQ